MTKYISQRSIDDFGGKEYERATDEQTRACRRRFEGGSATVGHPKRPGWLLHDIGNFWDGPKAVRVREDGDLEYTNPYTKETDRFNAEGSYYRDGSFHPWSTY